MIETKVHKALFELIREGLTPGPSLKGGEKSFPLGEDLGEADWFALFDLSEKQGVGALCVDGFNKIHPQMPADKKLRYRQYQWFGEAMRQEKKYKEQCRVLERLEKEAPAQHLVVLKGMTLARLWPIPEHRPCCDIDIYTGADHDKVDEWARSQGCEVKDEGEGKHSSFTIDGVHVENHLHFLDDMEAMRPVEEWLKKGMPTPDPYIFNLCHLARHFQEYESLSLRHIVDWALLVEETRKLGPEELRTLRTKVQEFGLEKIEALLTGCAKRVIAYPPAPSLKGGGEEAPERDVERALEDILRPKEKRSATILDWPRNMGLIFANRWKYRYVPNSWSERFWRSVISKLR